MGGPLEITTGYAVEYTGDGSKLLGIKRGDSADAVIDKLISVVEKIWQIGSECESCGDNTNITDVFNDVYRQLGDMSTGNIKHEGGIGDLTKTVLSADASALADRNVQFDVVPADGGADITVDLSQITTKLPQDNVVTKSNIVVSGKQDSTGSTTIFNTSNKYASTKVPLDRFPLTVQANVVVNTPSGDVNLNRTFQVQAGDGMDNLRTMDVKDTTAPEKSVLTTKDVLNVIADAVKANTVDITNLKRGR